MKLSRILYAVLGLLIILALTRLFLHSEIDDVTPGISCESDLLEKSDVLWIIPIFENNSIAEDKEWCSQILSLNKTLGLHGVHHTYNEFNVERNDDYIESGIRAFQECFNQTPTIFKAPQLAFNNSNSELLERHGLENKRELNQLFHKVYHCEDTGEFPNWFIDLF